MPRAARDKLMHAAGGACIAVVVATAWWLGQRWLPAWPAAGVGLGAALLAGVAKEAYDSQHRETHTVELRDALATVIGGLMGAGVWTLGASLLA